jgi:dTDP-glucose 4,6-dehydratase
MRVLVAGAAGFLGSHLCDKLLALGHRVIGLDNLITGRRANLDHLAHHPRFELIEHDVTTFIKIEGPLDGVFHLASPASPRDYLAFPIETLKVGALGTYRALGLARAKDARFLLASTSEVYGDPEVHPQPEGYWGHVNPTGPRSVYDEAKRFAEALTIAYGHEHGVETRIARIFNTYGPRMRPSDGRVVSNFIVQALRGDPLTVYGDGSHTRSLCYVDDLVDGLVRLFMRGDESPTNLGNPREFTMLELAECVLRLTGSSSPIAHAALPIDDPKTRCPDIRRARAQLGWRPAVPLEEGLQRTIMYFREVLAGVYDEGPRPPGAGRLLVLSAERVRAGAPGRGRSRTSARLAAELPAHGRDSLR